MRRLVIIATDGLRAGTRLEVVAPGDLPVAGPLRVLGADDDAVRYGAASPQLPPLIEQAGAFVRGQRVLSRDHVFGSYTYSASAAQVENGDASGAAAAEGTVFCSDRGRAPTEALLDATLSSGLQVLAVSGQECV